MIGIYVTPFTLKTYFNVGKNIIFSILKLPLVLQQLFKSTRYLGYYENLTYNGNGIMVTIYTNKEVIKPKVREKKQATHMKTD